jgi:hypothetical protein
VQVCDHAGNCATAGPISGIRVDRRAPQITIAAPLDGSEVVLGETRKASFTCSDGGSGVAACTGTVADGAALDTATPGAHSFTVSATDAVGNHATATVTYWVRFPWLGWAPPLSGDGPNADQAGRTIPVRFAVGGAGRANVIAGVLVAPVSCAGSSTVAAGDPSLHAADWSVPGSLPGNHRASDSMLLWRTSKAFGGSCQQLLVQLTDGSVHQLTFNFR